MIPKIAEKSKSFFEKISFYFIIDIPVAEGYNDGRRLTERGVRDGELQCIFDHSGAGI